MPIKPSSRRMASARMRKSIERYVGKPLTSRELTRFLEQHDDKYLLSLPRFGVESLRAARQPENEP